MSMAIIKNQQLIEQINDYKLVPLEVREMRISNQIHLGIDKTEEFFKFASDSNFKYIYYYYTYYNLEEYIIPLEWYSEYSKEFKSVVRQHNLRIKSLDFNSPKSLRLFILQNGTSVGLELYNSWMEDQGISVADDAIEEIENKFYSEVEEISSSKKNNEIDDENELREIVFNDPEFRYCKNQELRYYYLVELLEEENMKKYEYLVQPYGAPNIGKIKMFMDKTWMIYKEQKK